MNYLKFKKLKVGNNKKEIYNTYFNNNNITSIHQYLFEFVTFQLYWHYSLTDKTLKYHYTYHEEGLQVQFYLVEYSVKNNFCHLINPSF